MWNIMKAQNYQIKGDNLIICGLLFSLVLPVAGPLLDGAGFDYMSGSMYAVNMFAFFPYTFMIISHIIVTRIIGWDMNDKTMNYELLSGHSRAQVFFGRFIMSLAWTVIASVIVSAVPTVFFTVINGWGHSLKAGDFAVRFAAFLFPCIRWICEVGFITILVKNSNVGMVIGFLMLEGSVIVSEVFKELLDVKPDTLFACPNLLALAEISNSRQQLIGDEMVTVYDGTVNMSLLNSSIIVSLAAGSVFTLIGYMIFKKNDM